MSLQHLTLLFTPFFLEYISALASLFCGYFPSSQNSISSLINSPHVHTSNGHVFQGSTINSVYFPYCAGRNVIYCRGFSYLLYVEIFIYHVNPFPKFLDLTFYWASPLASTTTYTLVIHRSRVPAQNTLLSSRPFFLNPHLTSHIRSFLGTLYSRFFQSEPQCPLPPPPEASSHSTSFSEN